MTREIKQLYATIEKHRLKHLNEIKEKDAEIERLREYALQCESSVHKTQDSYAELYANISRLRQQMADVSDWLNRLHSQLDKAREMLETK